MIFMLAKSKDNGNINTLLVGLNELITNQGRGLEARDVLNLVDFFLVKSPRSFEGAKKSSAQTLVLNSKNWKRTEILDEIKKTLFDGKITFCTDQDNLLAKAKKEGIYFDLRIKRAKIQAFLLQEKKGKSIEDKGNCFFRHLRNALAHGSIFKLGHGKFLFLDRAEGNKGEITAYIITTPLRLDSLRANLQRGR